MSGTAVSGNLSATFSLYTSLNSNSSLHTEQQTIAVEDGYFKVQIGEISSLPAEIPSPLYLGITLGSDSEMEPRVELAPVPFALMAQDVENDSDLLAELSCSSGEVAQWNGSQWGCANITGGVGTVGPKGDKGDTGLSAYQVWINAGNSGSEADYLASLVGATGPQGIQGTVGPKGDTGEVGQQGIQGTVGPKGDKGDTGAQGPSGTSSWVDSSDTVSTTGTVYVTTDKVNAIRASVSSVGGTALVAQNVATTGYGGGLMGATSSESGAGVLASSSSTTGENYGVYSLHESNNGAAVFGHSKSTSGKVYGGYFKSDSLEGIALHGEAKAFSGDTVGVRGYSWSSSGVGVVGEVWPNDSGAAGVVGAAGSGAGVRGQTNSGTALLGSATLNSGTSLYLESVGGLLIDGMYDGNSDKIYTQMFKVENDGDVTGTNFYTWSSRRWKNNIQPLTDALGTVLQLQGTSYDSTRSDKSEVGFIAEEVGAVIPSAVQWEDNGVDAAGVDYSRLTPYLVEAIKAQQTTIEALTKRIEKLEELVQ